MYLRRTLLSDHVLGGYIYLFLVLSIVNNHLYSCVYCTNMIFYRWVIFIKVWLSNNVPRIFPSVSLTYSPEICYVFSLVNNKKYIMICNIKVLSIDVGWCSNITNELSYLKTSNLGLKLLRHIRFWSNSDIKLINIILLQISIDFITTCCQLVSL